MKKLFKRIKNKYRRFVNSNGYRNGTLRLIGLIKYHIFSKNIIMMLKKLIKKGKNRYIVFESRPDFSDNARALYEYMIANGYERKYKIIWLVDEPKLYTKYKNKGVVFVRKRGTYHRQRTVRAFYYVLKSKYVIFTHSLRWVEQRNENQIYLNLWHGCGYKAPRVDEESENNIFDYCLVPGPVFVKTKSDFFGCPEKRIIPIGYPRYDLFNRDNVRVDELFSSLNCKSKKNVLWMPTFRDSSQLLYYDDPIPAIIGFPLMRTVYDFDKLDTIAREANVNLIIKWHRNTNHCGGEKHNYTNVFYLDNNDLESNDIQLYEMIAKVDALITDFSSVAIDYLLMDKPLGFTMDDYEDYKKSRGFIFEDVKKYMPGTYMYDLDDLRRFLVDVASEKDEHKKARDIIMSECHNPTDEYCKRVLEYFEI